VNRKADGATGVAAVLDNYDTEDYRTANAISVENLQKPAIIEELKKLGFDTNNAKRVVGEILNDEDAEYRDKLGAVDKVFKVNGDYAPEKSVNINLDANSTERTKELGTRLVRLFRPGNRTSI
jgi:hypothetical protein